MEVVNLKFCWCTVTVNNMEESLQFYREIVGLSLIKQFNGGPDVEISFLGEGETQIELICNANHKPEGKASGVTLGFVVDSVDRKIDFINEMGLQVESGPYQPNPHVKFFYIRDPNGVGIQFVENL